jgi:hypothetical protein
MSYVKYPRTLHLPWSLGVADDDKKAQSTSFFEGRRVVVSEKMDGENTSLYRDHFHARSIDSRMHPSRSWLASFHAQMCQDIPEGWRVCGENLYAKHSIGYEDLPSYFLGFSVWNEKNECLDWDASQEWFHLLGVESVRVLYDGIYDEKIIKALHGEKDDVQREGYVLRVADGFSYNDFATCVAKFVRAGHVQTDTHWMHASIQPNALKTEVKRMKP